MWRTLSNLILAWITLRKVQENLRPLRRFQLNGPENPSEIEGCETGAHHYRPWNQTIRKVQENYRAGSLWGPFEISLMWLNLSTLEMCWQSASGVTSSTSVRLPWLFAVQIFLTTSSMRGGRGIWMLAKHHVDSTNIITHADMSCCWCTRTLISHSLH